MTLISLLDDSDVIVTLIITNFIFILIIQQWRSFFQIFVNGDVVNVQTWEELSLKNPIEPPYNIIMVKTCLAFGEGSMIWEWMQEFPKLFSLLRLFYN